MIHLKYIFYQINLIIKIFSNLVKLRSTNIQNIVQSKSMEYFKKIKQSVLNLNNFTYKIN